MTSQVITMLTGAVLPAPVLLYTAYAVRKAAAKTAAAGAEAQALAVAEVQEQAVAPGGAALPWLLDSRTACIVAAAAASLLGAIAAYRLDAPGTAVLTRVQFGVAFLVLLAAAVYDSRFRIIPNVLPLALASARIILLACEFIAGAAPVPRLLSSVAGAITAMSALLAASKLSRGGIGFGDVKLVGAVGFMCGFYAIIAVLVLALICCALVAAPLLCLKRKALSDSLPFAPFIYIGMAAVICLSLY